MKDWWIYRGVGEAHDGIERLPEAPNWRKFTGKMQNQPRLPQEDIHMQRRFGEKTRGATFQASEEEIDLINAALYLRRPLLVTGKPGSGKSTLAYAVAHELKLGSVLRWPITTRSTLADGLYQYDAIGRLQDSSLNKNAVQDIGKYIRLGALGTALLPVKRPRVLLIDEIDKSDIDLPNDLLNIFEEGEFDIPELARVAEERAEASVLPQDSRNYQDRAVVENGKISCHAFPFVVLTSNGERDFPPAFLRRCLRLDVQPPDEEKLTKIIEAHLEPHILGIAIPLIGEFLSRRDKGDLATDQLLNAIYLVSKGVELVESKDRLLDALLRYLSATEGI